jgi:methylated-DNA-[protein]-cysteine S-methyltransferase
MNLYIASMPSPVGPITVSVDEEGRLTQCTFSSEPIAPVGCALLTDDGRSAAVLQQLTEYFRGARTRFDVELAFQGTTFQRHVWTALCNIPYGETVSYLDIARSIGNEKAVRAVGAANGANPIAIIVPCHRVIGSNGSLVGYGGGMEAKKTLLALEQKQLRLL